MIEKLEDILFPFQGMESNPFMWLRSGIITKVYASAADCGTDKDPKRYVGTVEVKWLDRMAPASQLVPWTYAAFSNPTIKHTESSTSDSNTATETTQTSVGSSSGIFFVPSVNDIVLCGYRSQTNPVIVGFLPHNLYTQLSGTKTSFGNFRTLISGEYSIKSQQQSEIYLDRAGTVQLIVKQQPSGTGTPPIDTTTLPPSELARVSLGVTYDATFTNPVKSTYGQNVVCNVTMSNGAKVQIDNSGNIEVFAPGQMSNKSTGNFDLQSFATLHAGANTSLGIGSGGVLGLGGSTVLVSGPNGITMNGSAITLNNGSVGAARLNDATQVSSSTDSAFITFLTNLVTIFNAHAHTGVTSGGGTSGPPATPLGTAPSTVTGKITASSSTVNIG